MTGKLTEENRKALAELLVSFWNNNMDGSEARLRAMPAYNGVLVTIHKKGSLTGAKILIPQGADLCDKADGGQFIRLDGDTTLDFSRESGIIYQTHGFYYGFCDFLEG